MKKVLFLFLAITSIFDIVFAADDRPEAAAQLIGSFRFACRGRGAYSSRASVHTEAIRSVLEGLNSNDPCAPLLQSALREISTLPSELNEKIDLEDSYLEEEQRRKSINLYLHQWKALPLRGGSVPFGSLQESLEQKIVGDYIDSLSFQAKRGLQEKEKRKSYRYQRAKEINGALGRIVNPSSSLSYCLQSSPAAAMMMASQLGAYGGSMLSTQYALQINQVAQLFNYGIQASRNWSRNRQIRELYRVEMREALKCGLESLTDFYCEAHDTRKMLLTMPNFYENQASRNDGPWQAFDLINNRLPVLNEWLLKIKNGLPPSDPSVANRKNNIELKKQLIEQTHQVVQGLMAAAKRKYENLKDDPLARESIIVSTVNSIVGSLNISGRSSSLPRPFLEFSSDSLHYACRLLLGFEVKCPSQESIFDTEKYIRERILTADGNFTLDEVLLNWLQIKKTTTKIVAAEFADTIFVAPKILLALAWQKNTKGDSPLGTLYQIKDYLDDFFLVHDEKKPYALLLVNELKKLTQSAIQEIEKVNTGFATNKESEISDILNSLYDLFQLRFGLNYFNELVGAALREKVLIDLKSSGYSELVTKILRLHQGDIQTLFSSLGHSRVAILEDLETAISKTQSNINLFKEIFKDSFDRAIMDFKSQAKQAGERSTGINSNNLARLCTLWIVASKDKWPSWKVKEACQQASLRSPFYRSVAGQKNPLIDTLKIEVGKLWSDLRSQRTLDYSSQLCYYYRFKQNEVLYSEVFDKPAQTQRSRY